MRPERLPPGTPELPVSSLEELRAEVKLYRPVEVLAACRALSLKLSENRNAPLDVDIPAEIDKFGIPRVIRVAPYVVALIARLSLVEGSTFATGVLDDLQFRRLLRIVSELYEEGMPAVSTLLRTWDEQAWYQRGISHAIGRGLIWYRDIPRTLREPDIDLPSAFEDEIGMTVDDFFGCSFLVFTLARSVADSPYQFYTALTPGNITKRAQELIASDVMKKFLSAASTDPRGFQDLAQAWNPDTNGVGRYDLNPLFERPLVYVDGSGYIAPNPDMLIWMMDEQPYWRLRNRYKGDGGDQPFGRFFGKVIFERYIGELLADRMPDARRHSEEETRYGRNHLHGPDWLVIQGDIGIAIELVLATIPRSRERDRDEEATLHEVLADRVVPRISNMPRKIEGLIAGRPDLELGRVRRWHRLIVTKTALPWIGFTKPRYLDPLIDRSAVPYHVLSVEEFETLLAAETSYGVTAILEEAERDLPGNTDFRQLFSRLYEERHAPFDYGYLKGVSDEFFGQFLSTEGDPNLIC